MNTIYDLLTESGGYGDIARRIAASYRWEDLAIGEETKAITQ